MELLYFARIRENIGHSSEHFPLPEKISTAGDLIEHLRGQGQNYRNAFADEGIIRIAVNQTYVKFDHPVSDSDEVAFFPPMTGG